MKAVSSDFLRERLRGWLGRSDSEGVLRPRGEPFAVGSYIGKVRPVNQDRAVVGRMIIGDSSCLVAAVFDGMGGMRDGAQCAEIALASFFGALVTSTNVSVDAALRAAVMAADRAIYAIYRGEGGAAGVGVVVTNGRVFGFNAGDSRAYFLERDGVPRQVSFDDTLAAHVAAASHREASGDSRNQLLQFIGFGNELTPHFFEEAVTPDGLRGLLLTSDGIHGVPRTDFVEAARTSTTPKELVDRLIALAKENGGKDNATAVAISLREHPLSRCLSDVAELWGPASSLEIMLVVSDRTAQPASIVPKQTTVARSSPESSRSAASSALATPSQRRRQRRGSRAGNGDLSSRNKGEGIEGMESRSHEGSEAKAAQLEIGLKDRPTFHVSVSSDPPSESKPESQPKTSHDNAPEEPK